jgi:hypothetical protein
MIDHLSVFSKKIIWLKPLALLTTVVAFILFGYVVLFASGIDKDVYIIPCIVSVLWSLVFWLLLSLFQYVPPIADKQQRFLIRLKIGLVRGVYHIGSLLFFILSALVLLLSLRLLNVASRLLCVESQIR